MKGLINRSDQFFIALIAVFAVYVFLFMYFQISTYQQFVLIEPFQEFSKIEDEKEIIISKDNIELPNQTSGEALNISRNNEDKRDKSEKQWSENKSAGNPVQTIKEFEKKLFEEAGGKTKREQIKVESEKNKNQNGQNQSKTDQKSQNTQSNQYIGNVMVDFSLRGRIAYNNNNWHIRNPGYTCGFGSQGTVVMNIQVNANGKVVQATYDASKSSNASHCMIEQAEKYARMSRFNLAVNEINQTGYIRYQFVSQ